MPSQIESFFRLVFGARDGYVCVAFLGATDDSEAGGKRFSERFYKWPDESGDIDADIGERVADDNVYFCPQLFASKRRSKVSVRVDAVRVV